MTVHGVASIYHHYSIIANALSGSNHMCLAPRESDAKALNWQAFAGVLYNRGAYLYNYVSFLTIR